MRVEYITHSGDDLLVVDAARASFGKQSEWEVVGYDEVFDDHGRSVEIHPIKQLSAKDTKLIRFLAREKHLLPFRHPSVTLRCQAPLFVARQLGKHQAGMSWSEESRRYITTEPTFYWPDKWRKKADNVKQGSSDEEVIGPWSISAFGLAVTNVQTEARYMIQTALACYENMLANGVAPEQARMILPQNMMITWVWTGSLLAWVHMIRERTAPTTQRETQEFARLVETTMRNLYPVSMDALLDNQQ